MLLVRFLTEFHRFLVANVVTEQVEHIVWVAFALAADDNN